MRFPDLLSPMFGVVVLALALFGMPGHAVPQASPAALASAVADSGGGGGSGSGSGKPVTVTGCGIPNVTNAVNSVCIPWYGIRDTIMSEIFQGKQASLSSSFHQILNDLV
jgi:hypothetical protein